MDLRVGIIGCGMIGKEHAKRLQYKIQGVTVTAVCDVFEEGAKAASELVGGVRVYTDAAELINDPEVDAVVVTTPGNYHKDSILKAIAAGKPVFTEKPLTTTAAECKEIVDAEIASGKHLVQVGFMRRYDRGYNQVKELIETGEFGAPLVLKCTHRAESVADDYTTEMAVTDTAIHEIDVLPWLIGGDEWDEVQCIMPKITKNAHEGLKDPQVMIMKTKGGVVCMLEVNVNCGFGYDINCEVVCEDGVINLPCPSFPTTRRNFEVATAIEKNWILRFIDSYDVELQDWVDNVKAGTTGGSSAWDGYTAAITADALVASQKTGKTEKVITGGMPEFYKK
ncbi:Gfo/Idh/MocA family protein [Ruminococcus gauvreauii]|uniref:Gfo/Idh/MocA family protein n=1 Tax=Ruminococcus gauvreauii TaxID=438033 RepID=UPI0039842242